MTIPSIKKVVEYRPFLVKEEKVLLMALEGRDKKEIVLSIYNILETCVETKGIDIRSLPTFDIEYMFLNLRAKSVGEVVEFTLGHNEESECKHRTEVSINLVDVKVDGKVGDGIIMLTDKVGVKMRYPTIEAIEDLIEGNEIASVIASCIDQVFDEDDVYEDFTHEEMIAWLGNLNKKQYEMIDDFFKNTPKLKHKVEWKCKECGEKDSVTIEGLYNFFI